MHSCVESYKHASHPTICDWPLYDLHIAVLYMQGVDNSFLLVQVLRSNNANGVQLQIKELSFNICRIE